MHTLLLFLQWSGTILGIAGSPLVPLKRQNLRFWGFVIWLISDFCWFGYGLEAHVWGIFVNYSFFVGTAALGVWNNRRNS